MGLLGGIPQDRDKAVNDNRLLQAMMFDRWRKGPLSEGGGVHVAGGRRSRGGGVDDRVGAIGSRARCWFPLPQTLQRPLIGVIFEDRLLSSDFQTESRQLTKQLSLELSWFSPCLIPTELHGWPVGLEVIMFTSHGV